MSVSCAPMRSRLDALVRNHKDMKRYHSLSRCTRGDINAVRKSARVPIAPAMLTVLKAYIMDGKRRLISSRVKSGGTNLVMADVNLLCKI